MDMSVSPDLEAFCCYGLILVIGLAAAWAQISKRLGNLPGKWIMFNTWLLFFAYALLPVALFWFLDRTNAVHDTSLFAAVLIGIGYQQILSGTITTVTVPGEVSKFWQPFGAWADNIATRIRDRIIANNSRFDEKLLSAITNDGQKLNALKEVAITHATDAVELDKCLKEITEKQAIFGEKGVLAKEASLLYQNLKQSSPQHFDYLLYKSGVIPNRWYRWYAREWRSKTAALAVWIILILAAIFSIRKIGTPQNYARYYVWRLHKDNSTDFDHFRARKKLVGYLKKAPQIYPELTDLLRSPNLPVKTADNILALLIENREIAIASGVDLQGLLADSLHAENSDVRTRINRVLLYLAHERNAKVPQDLETWQSDPKQTAADLDKISKQWHQVK